MNLGARRISDTWERRNKGRRENDREKDREDKEERNGVGRGLREVAEREGEVEFTGSDKFVFVCFFCFFLVLLMREKEKWNL